MWSGIIVSRVVGLRSADTTRQTVECMQILPRYHTDTRQTLSYRYFQGIAQIQQGKQYHNIIRSQIEHIKLNYDSLLREYDQILA